MAARVLAVLAGFHHHPSAVAASDVQPTVAAILVLADVGDAML